MFKYTYLLSPAQTWQEFGELVIVFNTPYFVKESSLNEFAKTEGLPKGKLTFIMSSSESIKKVENSCVDILKFILLIVLGILVIIGMVISRVVRAMKKH